MSTLESRIVPIRHDGRDDSRVLAQAIRASLPELRGIYSRSSNVVERYAMNQVIERLDEALLGRAR